VAAAWLTELERLLAGSSEAEAHVLVAAAAGRDVPLDPDQLHAVVRRALLLHAAGGDALRSLDLDGRAVITAAADLDSPERRAALDRGLEELARLTEGRPSIRRAVGALSVDPDLAWRAWACAALLDSFDGD
jgi:hypothetical protein